MVHHVHEVECCQAQILQLGMVDDAWQKDWAQKPPSLRVEECANGATTEGGDVAAAAWVEAESPPRTPRRTPSAITPRFLTDLSQILDRQHKQYKTTETLRMLLAMSWINEAAQARREAEATA